MTVLLLLVTAVILQVTVSSTESHYKQLSIDESDRLASWTPESKQPMWELSGQFQGDMILTPSQMNGARNTYFRWRNREIPYDISSDFTEQEKHFIITSLEREYSKTCIRPRLRTRYDTDYVYVTGKNMGCWSTIGRVGGVQQINLQRNGCLNVGTVAHEFMHALGFLHQQSATERDDWVNIYWQNIKPGMEDQFYKYGTDLITSFGERYDYGSVMHYGRYAFSSNNRPTILPKDPNAWIGQMQGLSPTDVIKINKMYNCY